MLVGPYAVMNGGSLGGESNVGCLKIVVAMMLVAPDSGSNGGRVW